MLQITAPISQGSSGSPVLSKGLKVIGIAVAILKQGQNINFAVPVTYLKEMIKENKKELNKISRLDLEEFLAELTLSLGSLYVEKASPGEIDKDAILQALRRNQSQFQRCYQVSLNEKPSIQGNLGMQWLISPSGRGRSARATNNQIGSRSLANCVAGVLERLNFPEPPSGQTPKVTFTFRFYLIQMREK